MNLGSTNEIRGQSIPHISPKVKSGRYTIQRTNSGRPWAHSDPQEYKSWWKSPTKVIPPANSNNIPSKSIKSSFTGSKSIRSFRQVKVDKKIENCANESQLFGLFQEHQHFFDKMGWVYFLSRYVQILFKQNYQTKDNSKFSIQILNDSVARSFNCLEVLAKKDLKFTEITTANLFFILNNAMKNNEDCSQIVSPSAIIYDYLIDSLQCSLSHFHSYQICYIAKGLRKFPKSKKLMETLDKFYPYVSSETGDFQQEKVLVEMIHTYNKFESTNGLRLWGKLKVKSLSKKHALKLLCGLSPALKSTEEYFPDFNFGALIARIKHFSLTKYEFARAYEACCSCEYVDEVWNTLSKNMLLDPELESEEKELLTQGLNLAATTISLYEDPSTKPCYPPFSLFTPLKTISLWASIFSSFQSPLEAHPSG